MTHSNGSITNNLNSKLFLFRGTKPLKVKRSQPAIPVPLINTSPANTFLFRFQGKSQTYACSLVLFHDGTDVASGSHTSTVKTVDEQVAYLQDYIDSSAYNASWDLYDERYFPTPITGVITDLEFEDKGPNMVIVNFNFIQGRIGSI